MLGGSISSAQSIDQTRAATIKAAYLFHLASLTSWPDSILVQPGVPFRVVILGPDPHNLADILAANTRGTKIADHSLEVIRLAGCPAGGGDKSACREILDNCQILFVTKGAEEDFLSIAPSLEKEPILTVGETRNFPENTGGMVGFFIEKGRIRIKAHQDLASESGLKLSAEFLQHAILVESGNGGRS